MHNLIVHRLGFLPCRAAVLEIIEPAAKDHRLEQKRRIVSNNAVIKTGKDCADLTFPMMVLATHHGSVPVLRRVTVRSANLKAHTDALSTGTADKFVISKRAAGWLAQVVNHVIELVPFSAWEFQDLVTIVTHGLLACIRNSWFGRTRSAHYWLHGRGFNARVSVDSSGPASR